MACHVHMHSQNGEGGGLLAAQPPISGSGARKTPLPAALLSGERSWRVDKRYNWAQQGQALTRSAQSTVLQPSVGGEVVCAARSHVPCCPPLPNLYTLSCSPASQSPAKHHSAGHSQHFVGFLWLPAQPPNSQQALLSMKKVYYIRMYTHACMHAHTLKVSDTQALFIQLLRWKGQCGEGWHQKKRDLRLTFHPQLLHIGFKICCP